jgi:glycosyltransferase involved in cell wall biosynthesis
MKIAVYTIALNEEQFVERWYNSAKDADYILIADTGSTDKTVEVAKKLGIKVFPVSIKPWRFDDARNVALALLPNDIDICIALDMDEILIDGWREKLEGIKEETTRPRYKYTWSWNEDGTPGLEYGGDKIHARHGYRWRHPVHEVITADRIEEVQEWVGLEIHHHPDNSKPRSQYLPLLEASVKEDPYDDRNAFYYARELFFYGQLEQAANEFKRHLGLPTALWSAERAASYRYLAKCTPELAEEYLLGALKEDGNRREVLVELAQYYYEKEEWKNCFKYSEQAIKVKEKPLDYLCEDFAWGSLPYDYASIAAFNLNKNKEAVKYGKKAVELNPSDQRLINNLNFYLAKQ